MTELTPLTGEKIGLTTREVAVVLLVRSRFSRDQVAETLGIGRQTARDIIGGLCDHFDCPTTGLYGAVMLRLEAAENSEAVA